MTEWGSSPAGLSAGAHRDQREATEPVRLREYSSGQPLSDHDSTAGCGRYGYRFRQPLRRPVSLSAADHEQPMYSLTE